MSLQELKEGRSAQKHAVVVAKNLKKLIKGNRDGKLDKYKPAKAVAMVSLGRKTAVAHVPFLTVSGSLLGKIKSKDLFVSKTRKRMGLDVAAKGSETK